MIAEPQTHVACTRYIMSLADDPSMTFDDDGVCNVCRSFDTYFEAIPKTEEESRALLEPVIERIRKAGEGKPYDCVIGVSGGVDSTYIALLMRRFGLRPLAVHFDNGWNSELAVENIIRIVTKPFPEGHCVIAGNPARKIRDLDPDRCEPRVVSDPHVGYMRADRFKTYREAYLWA